MLPPTATTSMNWTAPEYATDTVQKTLTVGKFVDDVLMMVTYSKAGDDVSLVHAVPVLGRGVTQLIRKGGTEQLVRADFRSDIVKHWKRV